MMRPRCAVVKALDSTIRLPFASRAASAIMLSIPIRVVNGDRDESPAVQCSGGLGMADELSGKGSRLRIVHECNAADPGHGLLEQRNPFSTQRRLDRDKSGDVAARPRQVRDETAADRVAYV